MSSTPFRDLNVLTAAGDGTYQASIDPIWTIGPKVHGGSMMSLCAAAARRRLLDENGDAELSRVQPLAVGANYLSAPDPGEVTLSTTLRKQGKQVSFVDVELKQGDRVQATRTIPTRPPCSRS